MSDETEIATLKARLAASTHAEVLEYSEARKRATLPDYYLLVQLSQRVVDNETRLNGTFTPTGKRFSTITVAKSETNGRRIEAGVKSAFLLNPIDLDGQTTDVRWEQGGGQFGDPDDGGYVSSTIDWIYVR